MDLNARRESLSSPLASYRPIQAPPDFDIDDYLNMDLDSSASAKSANGEATFDDRLHEHKSSTFTPTPSQSVEVLPAPTSHLHSADSSWISSSPSASELLSPLSGFESAASASDFSVVEPFRITPRCQAAKVDPASLSRSVLHDVPPRNASQLATLSATSGSTAMWAARESGTESTSEFDSDMLHDNEKEDPDWGESKRETPGLRRKARRASKRVDTVAPSQATDTDSQIETNPVKSSRSKQPSSARQRRQDCERARRDATKVALSELRLLLGPAGRTATKNDILALAAEALVEAREDATKWKHLAQLQQVRAVGEGASSRPLPPMPAPRFD